MGVSNMMSGGHHVEVECYMTHAASTVVKRVPPEVYADSLAPMIYRTHDSGAPFDVPCERMTRRHYITSGACNENRVLLCTVQNRMSLFQRFTALRQVVVYQELR